MSQETPPESGSQGNLLITLSAIAASAVVVLLGSGTLHAASGHPGQLAAFAALTIGLQLLAIPIYGRGSISVAAIGLLATGFALGAGPAVAVGLLVALIQWARSRGRLHRAIFDAANFTLATAAAIFAYELVRLVSDTTPGRIVGSIVAGTLYFALNTGLLSWAMGLTERAAPLAVWRTRFQWLTGYFLAFGPLALASMIAYDNIGLAGLAAFAFPPAMMVFSVRQYLEKTRDAVLAVELVNENLRVTNAQLAARNDDLRDLFDFTGGLAPRVHDRAELVTYVEGWLTRLTGAPARIRIGRGSGGIPLTSGGGQVATLSLPRENGFDGERWDRLRDAIIPQLATAIESTALVDKVRKTYLSTIAALSRSMEAKDQYTSGHTERVSDIAVALGRKLGYKDSDLDAIETGAVLHDIGKIGIPEAVLQKPSALDDEEWELMRQHPVISDYILSEVDLPPAVRGIVRSSHERLDGTGYPDGLRGGEIPLPARIVSVADAWDALTSDRPYRKSRTPDEALAEIRRSTGTQFCPNVVAALEELVVDEPQLLRVRPLSAVA